MAGMRDIQETTLEICDNTNADESDNMENVEPHPLT